MNYKVRFTPDFRNELKQISKKHKGIKADIAKLIDDLETNPTMGTNLGQNLYKIRLAISGTNKGKSGGARIITYVVIANETVILAEIYLKSEQDTANENRVIQRLKDAGLV